MAKQKRKKRGPSPHRVQSITITSDTIDRPEIAELPEDVQNEIDEVLSAALFEGTISAIHRLEELVQAYPNVPILLHNLSFSYRSIGQTDKAEELTLDLERLFPDYLFARVSKANHLIYQGKFDQILDCFDGHQTIDSLYPDRNAFHYSEVIAFNLAIVEYHCQVGSLLSARALLDSCRAILDGDEHKNVDRLEEIFKQKIYGLAKIPVRDIGDGTATYTGIEGEFLGPSIRRMKETFGDDCERIETIIRDKILPTIDHGIVNKFLRRFVGDMPLNKLPEAAIFVVADYLVMEEGRHRETRIEKYRRKHGKNLDPYTRALVDGLVDSRMTVATVLSIPDPSVCVVYDHIAMCDTILLKREFPKDVLPTATLVYREVPLDGWSIVREPLMEGPPSMAGTIVNLMRMHLRNTIDLSRLFGKDREQYAEFMTRTCLKHILGIAP